MDRRNQFERLAIDILVLAVKDAAWTRRPGAKGRKQIHGEPRYRRIQRRKIDDARLRNRDRAIRWLRGRSVMRELCCCVVGLNDEDLDRFADRCESGEVEPNAKGQDHQ